MGRSAELDESAKEKLPLESAGTSHFFSTYDDLADRYETIGAQFLPQEKAAPGKSLE